MNTLTLWSPLTNVDRLFSDLVGARVNEDYFVPSCETDETDSSYTMAFDLPGVAREDISIELKENVLSVTGTRKNKNIKFQRSFKLPHAVEAEKVEALHQDGVLKLTLPKAESAKPRQIQIKSA